VSSTQAIGPEGGEIHLAAAGMTFVFPAGAVDHVTEITASAPASDFVEFRLEPEGTRLRLPATVRVEFGTSAGTALMRSTTPVPTGAGRSGLLTNRPVLEDWILLEPIQAAEEASRTQAVLYSVTLLSGYVCASG
jgi:hypothetical protein